MSKGVQTLSPRLGSAAAVFDPLSLSQLFHDGPTDANEACHLLIGQALTAWRSGPKQMINHVPGYQRERPASRRLLASDVLEVTGVAELKSLNCLSTAVNVKYHCSY